MFAPCLALAAVAALAGSPEGPGPYPPTGSNDFVGNPPHPRMLSREQKALAAEYQAKAQSLRTEMIALQKSDGGKLTGEHRLYLRGKASELIDAYHRDLQLAGSMNASSAATPRN